MAKKSKKTKNLARTMASLKREINKVLKNK